MYVGATNSPDYAKEAGLIAGRELRLLGINTVLAPVADINNNDKEDVVGKRAFGAHKSLVADMAACFMEGLQESNVLSVAKHFPGHGDAPSDPHDKLPKINYVDKNRLLNWDLYPFTQLIDAGVNGIMTAHLLTPELDAQPVTISRKAITDRLRGEYKFKGMVISDNIADMRGILLNERGDTVRDRLDAVTRAYEAGTDIVMLAYVRSKDDDTTPHLTVSLEEFRQMHEKLLSYFTPNDKRTILKKAVSRVLRQKAFL